MAKSAGVISQYRNQGHGEYRIVTQDEFLPAVTKSKYAICHIFHHVRYSTKHKQKINDENCRSLLTYK